MHTFKEFFNITESEDESLKNEKAARNIARIINLSTDKYVRKAVVKGQREGIRLVIMMHDGDVFDVITNYSHNITS